MGFRPFRHEGARWLVLLLDGVRREDLTPEQTPNLCEALPETPWCPLRTDVERGAVRQFLGALPADELRREGLELDRRSFCLRPDWQSDRSVIDSLTYRPRGRADVTVLWFRDAGRAALECGLDTDGYRLALAETDRDVLRAAQMTRRDGLDSRVVTLVSAPPEPVDRAFDLVEAMQRCLPRAVLRKLAIDLEPAHARIVCDSMHEVAVCAERLTSAPFTNHGSIMTPAELDDLGFARRPDRLVFVPFERVALGPRGTRAAASLRAAPRGSSIRAPWITSPAESMSVADVAQQFAEQVRTELRPVPVDETPIRQAIGDFPDLLHVLEHDLQYTLELARQALGEAADFSAD
ncbi:MAG: hypothetical protein KDB80_13610 [Planctomycetes bacterium]|nr:hypothetical protein [Planctomycetota bacterium]